MDECISQHVCPECAAGKHGNCDGGAWCLVDDGPTPCSCAGAGHQPADRSLRALGYIDQTIYGVEDVPATTWRSDEVVAMLRAIRALIVADVEPALPGLEVHA